MPNKANHTTNTQEMSCFCGVSKRSVLLVSHSADKSVLHRKLLDASTVWFHEWNQNRMKSVLNTFYLLLDGVKKWAHLLSSLWVQFMNCNGDIYHMAIFYGKFLNIHGCLTEQSYQSARLTRIYDVVLFS